MIAEFVNWVDQLQTTLSQMEAALEVITDAVVFLNEDQQIQWSNKAFSSLVNRPQDKVFGSNLIDLLPLIQSGKSVVRESYPDVMMRHGEYESTAYEFQQGDRCLLLQISGHSVTTPQGASSTVLVIQNITQQKQNITERQRAEAALLSSEAQYRDLVQTANCIILRWDHQGNILFLNEYGQRFLGFDAKEIVGCNVVGTIVPQTETSGRDLQKLMVDICQHPEHYLLNENENIRKNGQRVWIVWANKPIFDKQGNLVEILSIGTDTTERREFQAALENSLSLLWAIFESIQDGILAIDYSGNIVSYNQKFLEMWSIPPEVLAEPNRDKRLQYLANQLKNPDEFIHRVRELYAIPEASTCDLLEFKDGRVFERYSCPQRLGTEIVGRVWSFRDITDRKRAEDALQQSELKFRTIVENVNDIIFMLNPEGVYTYVSPNISQILGYTATEIEGKHLTVLIHPDDLQICYSDWQKTLALGKQSGAEMRVRHKNGSWRWLSCHTSIVNSLSGGVVLLGVSRDITERKQTEAALEHRAQVDSLLSSISRQFIDQDVDTAINFTLEAIAQFIGVERSCIFEYSDDQSQFSLIYEWCADGIQALSSRAQGTATTIVPWFHNQMLSKQFIQLSSLDELPAEAEDEKVMFKNESIQSVVAVPTIHSGKVVGFLGVDVVRFSRTWNPEEINLLKLLGELIAIGRARHKAEQALVVAKEAAVREAVRSADANRAKSTFLANMSHELRTPLNAILGFAQLMERETTLTPYQRESLAIINRSGEHLLNLINDVLEMSKIEAGRTVLNAAPFNLYQLLQTLQEMFQVRTQGKPLSLQFDIAANVPNYVVSDEVKLRQVLINLLGNAVKFTPTGSVTLRASLARDNSVFKTELRANDRGEITLYFEIEDTGQGIYPEEIENLFQPFVQTGNGIQAREGTGLGLAISRQFVRLMGGDIQVRSTVGQGSTFCFDIQVTLANPPAAIAQPSTERRVMGLAPNQSSYRILIVDDRAENREPLAQLLKSVGFETRTAINGQDAIASWQEWHPHLIWMDMRMPVMDGYEATQIIKAKEQEQRTNTEVMSIPKTVIIALTASAFTEQKAHILAVGCDDFVGKPFQGHIIFDKMAEHLGVQYIYGEEQENLAGGKKLTSSDLTVMSADWIKQLHQAALEVDTDQLVQLIDQIPPQHFALIESLTELVDNFCFDEIFQLT